MLQVMVIVTHEQHVGKILGVFSKSFLVLPMSFFCVVCVARICCMCLILVLDVSWYTF
jgi:hypothetical protein